MDVREEHGGGDDSGDDGVKGLGESFKGLVILKGLNSWPVLRETMGLGV